MKPFDWEKAKAGDPVVTRDGRKVRVVPMTVRRESKFVVLGFVEMEDGNESVQMYTIEGKREWAGIECHFDLFMAPKKTKYWIGFGQHKGRSRGTTMAYKEKPEYDPGYDWVEVEVEE